MISSLSRSTMLLLAANCLLTGCAGANLLKWSNKPEVPQVTPENPIQQVLSIWQPAEGVFSGRTSRGFSGQIYFFTAGNPLPAEADGDVTVYVFDDVGTDEEQVKPIHQFRYTADAWKKLKAQGKVGTTYGIFIPYTRPGTEEAHCSLRVRYTPANGPTIYSEMANVPLPGSHRDKPEPGVELTATNLSSPGGLEASKAAAALANATRGTAEAPPQGVGKAGARRRAEPLDEANIERIMRETKARLAVGEGVVAAGYEAPARRPAKTARHVLSAEADGLDYDEEAGPPQTLRPASTRPSEHVLSDDSEPADDEVAAEDEPVVTQPIPGNSRHIRSQKRQQLQLEASQKAFPGRQKFGSHTISLSTPTR